MNKQIRLGVVHQRSFFQVSSCADVTTHTRISSCRCQIVPLRKHSPAQNTPGTKLLNTTARTAESQARADISSLICAHTHHARFQLLCEHASVQQGGGGVSPVTQTRGRAHFSLCVGTSTPLRFLRMQGNRRVNTESPCVLVKLPVFQQLPTLQWSA